MSRWRVDEERVVLERSFVEAPTREEAYRRWIDGDGRDLHQWAAARRAMGIVSVDENGDPIEEDPKHGTYPKIIEENP